MIQNLFSGMFVLLLARFVLNDVPHFLYSETTHRTIRIVPPGPPQHGRLESGGSPGAHGMGGITYEITSKGRVLARFETHWWRETLTELQRLIMLTLYIAKRPLESKFIASEVGADVLQVEAGLRQLEGWRYVERKFSA